jgi:hypothetical protein
MSETSETPLPTQPAAPPVVPPKRPNVCASLADDSDARGQRIEELRRQLDEVQRQIDAQIARFKQNRVRLWPEDLDA